MGLQHVTQRPLVPTTPSRWCGTNTGTLMPASHTFKYKIPAPQPSDAIQWRREAESHHGILLLIGLIMRWPKHFCKIQLAGIFGKIAENIAGKAWENALQHLIGFLSSLAPRMDLSKSQHQIGRGYTHLLTAIAGGIACGDSEHRRPLDDLLKRGRSRAA